MHRWNTGAPREWEFARIWHLEPSLTDPDTVYAGGEDAALFRSTDGGEKWHELAELRNHASASTWQAGPCGCACTRFSWTRITPTGSSRDLGSGRLSQSRRRHDLASIRGRAVRSPHDDASVESETALHAKARRRDAQQRRGTTWENVNGNLPADFGFAIEVHAHEPETLYAIPLKSASEQFPVDGKLRVYRSRTGAPSGNR